MSADPSTLESIAGHMLSKKGKAVYDSHTNSLIVIDTPANLDKIAEVIEEVDVVPKMVNVEVLIVEASREFIKDIGLRGARVVLPGGRFQTILSLLNSRKDAHISSKSMVKTMSNRPARLQVTRDAVIAVARYIYFPSGATFDIPVMEAIGDTLDVLPLVNADNTITLDIRPSMSTLDDSHSPYERSVSTQVVVNNGDTLVLSGLDAQKKEQRSKSTFLGIPLSSTKTQESKNLVMFVTAEIVE